MNGDAVAAHLPQGQIDGDRAEAPGTHSAPGGGHA
jgi:hypothetical protein